MFYLLANDTLHGPFLTGILYIGNLVQFVKDSDI